MFLDQIILIIKEEKFDKVRISSFKSQMRNDTFNYSFQFKSYITDNFNKILI